jgi:ectoine hydroxylase-related dioxygenase (phytanoyl-CoA dioxygenase family)
MTTETYEFFKENGYAVLGKVLSDDEVARHEEAFDRNRKECQHLWFYQGHDTHQTGNMDTITSWPEVDDIVRHPGILPVVQELMGGEMSILEVSARHMDVHPGTPKIPQQWHRDTPHNTDHPLGVEYIQAMVYLTDVTEETHCFAISPQGLDDPVLDTEEQLKKAGGKPLYGPAGTAILFNASTLHAGTIRSSAVERKTVQTYFCHREKTLGKLDMVIPASLWRDHADPGAAALYGAQMEAFRQPGYREFRAGHTDIDMLPDPAIAWAQDRCPWNEEEGNEEHRCLVSGEHKCRYFQGMRRPDIVLCGYPQK